MLVVTLDTCESTQDEVRARLERTPQQVVAVRARSQRAGRGRSGRMWDDPPGSALLFSIGTGAGLDIRVLEDLPRRVALLVREVVCLHANIAESAIEWKPPNDLVVGPAKLGGVLIDARTSRQVVEEIVVGIGVNLDSEPFTTRNGRTATSIRSVSGMGVDPDALARTLAERLTPWITPEG